MPLGESTGSPCDIFDDTTLLLAGVSAMKTELNCLVSSATFALHHCCHHPVWRPIVPDAGQVLSRFAPLDSQSDHMARM